MGRLARAEGHRMATGNPEAAARHRVEHELGAYCRRAASGLASRRRLFFLPMLAAVMVSLSSACVQDPGTGRSGTPSVGQNESSSGSVVPSVEGSVPVLDVVWTVPLTRDRSGSILIDGVAVDQVGNVFVVDSVANRVLRLDSTGRVQTSWRGTRGGGQFNFNVPATRPGELFRGGRIAVDRRGDIYVADTGNYRIQKFSGEGRFLTSWGVEASTTFESGRNRFGRLFAVAVDRSITVYALDNRSTQAMVREFDAMGHFHEQWGRPGLQGLTSGVVAIAVDPGGTSVYLADYDTDTIQRFAADGSHSVTPFDTVNAHLSHPIDLAVDDRGHVFATQLDLPLIQEYSADGQLLHTYEVNSGSPEPARLTSIAIGPGAIYAFDASRGSLLKLRVPK